MADPKPARNPHAAAVAFFAVLTLLSIGLCGISFYLPSTDQEFHTNAAGGIAILGMLAGILGMIVSGLIWLFKIWLFNASTYRKH